MTNYAGFWIRVGAYVIDAIILAVVGAILGGIFGSDSSVFSLADLLGIFIGLGYFALMESSSRQATLGKQALGLIVTDLDGHRISVGKAVGRYFAKILSALILLIGFIMVAFTERKQGLHDIIVGTLVIKGKPGGNLSETFE